MKVNSRITQLDLFLRSLFFTVLFTVVTFFYSFICVLALPLPFKFRYALITAWTGSMIWMLKKICKINYQVEGLENITNERSGIVLSKHQSAWETFFLPGIFKHAAIIVKRELLWIPFFGWGLSIIDPISINRSKKSDAMEQIIQKGQKCLDEGRWIVVFPEGTRIPYGKVGKYRLGGARLAVRTGYPVIPVAHNAGRYWAKRKFIKTPGTIHVVIGPLIETKDRTAEDVMEEVKTWIEGTVQKIDLAGSQQAESAYSQLPS